MDTISMLNTMSFYCQPILPLVYDESMSYYETLCKVVGQLNTTGETVNKLNEGLAGEISDRQAADAALDERLKKIEETYKRVHFLVFDGANPNSIMPTRGELYQWVKNGDAIITLFSDNETGRGKVYAVSCGYNAGQWESEASPDFSIIVPIETSYDSTTDYAVRQKIAKLTIPPVSQPSLSAPWDLQIINITAPTTTAEGVVNLVAVIAESGAVNCSITPSEFLQLYNQTRAGKNLCVAVNAKLAYDGVARSSSIATVDTTNRIIRVVFERDYGTTITNGVNQLNRTIDYLIGDAKTGVWTHESIDSKVFDFPRYEGFQFTRGAHNVITTDDESTPNAVYVQYHSGTSGKLYQNLPVRLIDTVDGAEYWNGTFDMYGENHMTFTFVTSNYATASGKMLVRVIELSADVNTTAWKYGVKEFTLPISGSDAVYIDFWPTGSDEKYDNGLKGYTLDLMTNQTYEAVYDLIGSGAEVIARLYSDSDKTNLVATSVNTQLSGDKTLGSINFLFFHAAETDFNGFPSTGDAILMLKTSNSTSTFALYKYCTLPLPAADGGDSGKVPSVNGKKWELKELPVDNVLSSTSTNPVQNKVVKAALDGKASTAVATEQSDGLMSALDKRKLNGIEDGANKTIVDEALSDGSTNPVQNKVVKAALDGKASTAVATEQSDGLMSALDKRKLNGIEDGANKTIVDEALSDGSTNPVQNKVVTAALAAVVRETIYPIAVTATSAEWVVNNGIAYKEASADRTFDNIKAAYNSNKTPVCEFEGMTYSLILDSSTEFVFASYRGAVANDSQYAGLGKYPTSLITINTTGVVISRAAGDLPAVGEPDNGKMLIVIGGEWALQKVAGTTVDAELSTTSENPVQNKTVTEALNGKLPMTGGTVTGALRTNDSFSAGGSIAFGAAPIGLSQAADDAAQIRAGCADVDDNPPPLARLKVASPTEDDDAATRAYVNGRNFNPKFKGYVTLSPSNEPLGTGVGLSPSKDGNNYALNISDVNENKPTLLTGVKTPTDADTNAAATVEYVKAKVTDFVINGTVADDGTATLDKTFAQIQAAIQEGKQPVVKLSASGVDPTFIPMVTTGSTAIVFTGVTDAAEDVIAAVTITITSADVVSFVLAGAPAGAGASTPLVLAYANGQATGASYSEIRKAIDSGRQIKLAVANTLDIIASNAKNETDKSYLKFISTDVGGDTLNITQYSVVAQASGITVSVKSREL